jgi:hypothetical protein
MGQLLALGQDYTSISFFVNTAALVRAVLDGFLTARRAITWLESHWPDLLTIGRVENDRMRLPCTAIVPVKSKILLSPFRCAVAAYSMSSAVKSSLAPWAGALVATGALTALGLVAEGAAVGVAVDAADLFVAHMASCPGDGWC